MGPDPGLRGSLGLLQRLTHRWAALRRTDAQLEAIDAERQVFEAASAAGKPEAMNESNWRFHALIAAACGNRIIERDFLHVLTLNLRIAHLAYSPDCFASPHEHREYNDRALRDHRDIVQALRWSGAMQSWGGCGSWTAWHATPRVRGTSISGRLHPARPASIADLCAPALNGDRARETAAGVAGNSGRCHLACLLASAASRKPAGSQVDGTGPRAGRVLFNVVFVAVIASVAVQGWTAVPVARLLRLRADDLPEQ